MQPLYSVDHETRQSSNRREDEAENVVIHEDTPLLHRFPPQQIERNTSTTITVTSLLTILVLGVVIGIYLLIIQSNSENILPPVETPLQLVSKSQWDPASASHPKLSSTPMESAQVIVVQTDTKKCQSTDECSALLRKLQGNTTQLPYNFLVSSNGQTYEALGWHRPSTMFPQYPGAMVLAFIGNFTETGPTQVQRDEAEDFFAESMSQRHLSPHYIIVGRSTAYVPQALFQYLRTRPQWSEEASG